MASNMLNPSLKETCCRNEVEFVESHFSNCNTLLETLAKPLEKRKKEDLARSLTIRSANVDFCSNDYLGLSQSSKLADLTEMEWQRIRSESDSKKLVLGSTGSRLLTGNNEYYERVENLVTQFYKGESGLLFNSGYDLNLGLLASLPQPNDIVLFDELMHNSVREGLKLSRGSSRLFRHNDMEDLEAKLVQVREDPSFNGNIIISVESVYSMDGHCAPLVDICALSEKYGANVVVDEAHGVGVFGESGRGLVCGLGLENKVFCRVCTFGKALGAHGAILLGPPVLRDYMINYCRPLIYSTSMPTHSLAAIRTAHQFLEEEGTLRQEKLYKLVEIFKQQLHLHDVLKDRALISPSAIQGVIIPGNENVVRVSKAMQQMGWDIMPIRSPTVPKGGERLRIILHYHNSTQEIVDLVTCLVKVISALDSPTTASMI